MAVKVNIEKNFRDFSLKVDFEGSSAAIGLLGASGSGKSMTLRCIACLLYTSPSPRDS